MSAAKKINLDAPYRSALHAIRAAFATEATGIVEVSSYFADLRGGTVPLVGREPLTQHDRHAQAAMVLWFIEQRLEPLEYVAVRARHTIPETPVLHRRKEVDAKLLYQMVVVGHEPRDPPADFGAYAIDAIRGWMHLRRDHGERWWARRMERDLGTLRRWRWGTRRRAEVGFLSRVESLYQTALGKVAEPLYEAGMTQE